MRLQQLGRWCYSTVALPMIREKKLKKKFISTRENELKSTNKLRSYHAIYFHYVRHKNHVLCHHILSLD